MSKAIRCEIKVHSPEQREWYSHKTAENGWSHRVLTHQIESNLYTRQVLANKVFNFENRLPSPQSELAVQTMKDPYIFDFIPFREDMVERDIENALVKDVTKLLLELGTGFAFLGNQYHINVGGDDFYIDLLAMIIVCFFSPSFMSITAQNKHLLL